jgi:tryptophan 2,3-dioxygenase
MLARVSKIMEQLVHAWDVLATMTPPEYSAIRPYLASSSGFQSAQYRCIEFALGNKNAAMLKPHQHRADLLAMVQAAFEAPSLYDESLRLLARRGIAVPASPGARLDTALPGRPAGRAGLAGGLPRSQGPTGTSTSWARS